MKYFWMHIIVHQLSVIWVFRWAVFYITIFKFYTTIFAFTAKMQRLNILFLYCISCCLYSENFFRFRFFSYIDSNIIHRLIIIHFLKFSANLKNPIVWNKIKNKISSKINLNEEIRFLTCEDEDGCTICCVYWVTSYLESEFC